MLSAKDLIASQRLQEQCSTTPLRNQHSYASSAPQDWDTQELHEETAPLRKIQQSIREEKLTNKNFGLCEQMFVESQDGDFPKKFNTLGREFVLHKNVFSPLTWRCATAIVPALPLKPGQAMLDMGCGTGVMGISACLEYDLSRVLCADISMPAVKNCAENVHIHGLDKKISCVQSDVFGCIKIGQKFDLIFWNSPYLDHAHTNRSELMNYMVSDPNYKAHENYVTHGLKFLKPNGKLMLMISEDYFPLAYMNKRLNKFGVHAEKFKQATDDIGHTQLLLNIVKIK